MLCNSCNGAFSACIGATPLAAPFMIQSLPDEHGWKDIHGRAGRGVRALGIAKMEGDGSDPNSKWEFVGLVTLYDPPRVDTKDTIDKCRAKGIRVKMITGDDLLIGMESARQLGMGQKMYTTEALIKVRSCGATEYTVLSQ